MHFFFQYIIINTYAAGNADPHKTEKKNQEGQPMIEFKNVTKSYGDKAGLSDVNLSIDDGEFVFLVGPSGAGKSTFIKLILKEIDPEKGQIFFRGRDITRLPKRLIPGLRRDLGIVFQDFRLLPKKTVYENVAFAMEAVHQRKKLIKEQVPHILKLVGISEQAERYPHELSGGEAQRVAIARAIVNNPKVLIADEPTGNLDPEKSWEIMNLLDQINLRGTTVVMVTHAKDIVDRMGKRVIQIAEGRVVRDDAAGFYIQTDEPDMPVQAVLDDMIAESESDVLQAGMINESLTSGLSEEDLSIFGEISQMSELVGEDEIPVSAGDGRGILPEDSAEPKVSGSAVETSPASAETVKKDEPENDTASQEKDASFAAPAVKTGGAKRKIRKKRGGGTDL